MEGAVRPGASQAEQPTPAESRRGTPKWAIYAFELFAVIALAVAAVIFYQPPSPSPLIVTGDTSFVATASQLQTPIALTLPDESTEDAGSSISFVFPKDGPFKVSPATLPDEATTTTANRRSDLLNACRAILVARLDLWSARTADDLKSWGVESQIEEQLTAVRKIALAQEKIGQLFVAAPPAREPSRFLASSA